MDRSIVAIRDLLVETYAAWRDDRTIRMGAGLAYYGLFSLSSVLAVALGLFRIIGRSAAVESEFAEQLTQIFGSDAGEFVNGLFEQLDGSAGTQLGLIGLGSLLVTGSLFFLALEDALNQIWHVPVAAGIRSSARRRLTSLVVLLCAALTLVLAFAVQSVTSLLQRLLPGTAAGSTLLGSLLTSVLGWALLAAAIGLLFRYLPRADVGKPAAVVAGIATAALLVIGTAGIGWYLRSVGGKSLGGVVSTPIVVLLWIYYEAQIVLAGAQLAKVLDRRSTPPGETSA